VVHELSWSQAFLLYHAVVKIRNSGPVTFTFDLLKVLGF